MLTRCWVESRDRCWEAAAGSAMWGYAGPVIIIAMVSNGGLSTSNVIEIWFQSFMLTALTNQVIHAVEAPVSGHPREAEKVSETGAGRLRECINTECV